MGRRLLFEQIAKFSRAKWLAANRSEYSAALPSSVHSPTFASLSLAYHLPAASTAKPSMADEEGAAPVEVGKKPRKSRTLVPADVVEATVALLKDTLSEVRPCWCKQGSKHGRHTAIVTHPTVVVHVAQARSAPALLGVHTHLICSRLAASGTSLQVLAPGHHEGANCWPALCASQRHSLQLPCCQQQVSDMWHAAAAAAAAACPPLFPPPLQLLAPEAVNRALDKAQKSPQWKALKAKIKAKAPKAKNESGHTGAVRSGYQAFATLCMHFNSCAMADVGLFWRSMPADLKDRFSRHMEALK
jgi:hypothetical protein